MFSEQSELVMFYLFHLWYTVVVRSVARVRLGMKTRGHNVERKNTFKFKIGRTFLSGFEV